jgi:hypothetical protein
VRRIRTTWVKVSLSLVGSFLVGLTTSYQANPTSGSPLTWVMGGLAVAGGYLVGFWQLNPSIRQRKHK